MSPNVVHVMKIIQDAGPDAAPAKSHGWSHEVEVLVTVYWLACGADFIICPLIKILLKYSFQCIIIAIIQQQQVCTMGNKDKQTIRSNVPRQRSSRLQRTQRTTVPSAKPLPVKLKTNDIFYHYRDISQR